MYSKIAFGLFVIILSSCASANNSNVYLTDSQMLLSMKKCEKMELNYMLYREGSSGATGGKAGGGCGCN